MAEISVAPQSHQSQSARSSNSRSGNGYQLHPAHKAAILAGSDSAKLSQEIERQRQQFIENNGDDGTH